MVILEEDDGCGDDDYDCDRSHDADDDDNDRKGFATHFSCGVAPYHSWVSALNLFFV